ITIDEKAKNILDAKLGKVKDDENAEAQEMDDDSNLWMTASFNNLEDVIQLSHYFQGEFESDLITVLYFYKDQYYIYVELSPSLFEHQDDILSQVLEYSNESEITYHLLDEYGKIIFDNDVFAQVRKHFKANI